MKVKIISNKKGIVSVVNQLNINPTFKNHLLCIYKTGLTITNVSFLKMSSHQLTTSKMLTNKLSSLYKVKIVSCTTFFKIEKNLSLYRTCVIGSKWCGFYTQSCYVPRTIWPGIQRWKETEFYAHARSHTVHSCVNQAVTSYLDG